MKKILLLLISIVIIGCSNQGSNQECNINNEMQYNDYESIYLYDEIKKCYYLTEEKGIMKSLITKNGKKVEEIELNKEEEELMEIRYYIENINENIINIRMYSDMADGIIFEHEYVEGTYDDFLTGKKIQIRLTKKGEETFNKVISEEFSKTLLVPEEDIEVITEWDEIMFMSKSQITEQGDIIMKINCKLPKEYCEE